MDYTGIIQLIIATVFYSTLVAPNIKKMGDLRSDISDIHFPLKNDTGYAEILEELSIVISKKMHQYSAIYNETQKFLILLYLAMVVAIVSQALPIAQQFFKNPQDISSLINVNLLVTVTIFVLLVVAMRIFILKPERIRSFSWLGSVGISRTYSNDLFQPSLQINNVGKNLRESNNHVNIGLTSNLALYGYNIILTIENMDGTRLYHVTAGRVQKEKHLNTTKSYYRSGRQEAQVDLVRSLRLKPGQYKVRLLIFQTIYPGSAHPTEVFGAFEITTTEAKTSIVDVDLGVTTDNYSHKSNGNKLVKVTYNVNEIDRSSSFISLISVPRFKSHLVRTQKLFYLSDVDGMLTYDAIYRIMSMRRIVLREASRMFKVARVKLKRSKRKNIPCLDLSDKKVY